VTPSASSTSSKKVWIRLHVPLRPPFIRRWRDFYIPTTPLASENIPSVNAYMTVFFIPHIYKSATCSHSKPGLFGTTTLTLLLPWFVNVLAWNFRTRSSTDSRISRSPKFGPSTVEIPGFRMFVTPPPHRIKIPELCTFANSRLRRFQVSENREFPAPEKHASRTLLRSTFRGWRVFLNSPTDYSVKRYSQACRRSIDASWRTWRITL
jgi:hypothetical protein